MLSQVQNRGPKTPAPGVQSVQILNQLILLQLSKPKSIFTSLKFFFFFCLQIYTNIYTDQIFFRIMFQDFECLEFTLFCIATVIFPLVTGVRKLSGNKTEALLEKHDTEGGCLSHPY